MFSIILYVASVIAANFTANDLITYGPVTFGVGTLFFGLTFTMRDRIHSLFGKRVVYLVITTTVLLSVLQSMFLGVPIRIIVASTIAMALSELTDTEVFHSLASRSWHIRVLRSNAISTPLDSFLFTGIAFLGILPLNVLISKIITDAVIKFLVSAAIIAYKAPQRRAEAHI